MLENSDSLTEKHGSGLSPQTAMQLHVPVRAYMRCVLMRRCGAESALQTWHFVTVSAEHLPLSEAQPPLTAPRPYLEDHARGRRVGNVTGYSVPDIVNLNLGRPWFLSPSGDH